MQWQSDILFDPLLPPVLIATGLAVALLLIALLARAGLGRTGLLLRTLAAFTLALALLNPQLRQQQRQPLPDIALIIADASASQQLDGRNARTEQAVRQLRQKLAALPNTEVRIHTLPADDGSRGTRLVSALKQALSEVPPERFAGAFLITDGRAHDMPADARRALPPGYDAPLHVLLSGRRNERDRWLRITRAGRYGIIGKELPIRFRLRQHPAAGNGTMARTPVPITVRVNGKPWRTLQATPEREVWISVPVEHAGQNVVELIAPPMPGAPELTLRNNHVVHVFKGVRDRLRVLLVSGKPHPGERIWRNLLKSDPMVDLVHFTILRPPAKQDGTPISELALIAFPTYELFVEKLRNFDLIIFDRYQRRSILTPEYLRNVADYVREGGAVLLTVGPEFAEPDSLFYSPLAEILPYTPSGRIIETPYRATLSATGRRHPLTATLDGGKASSTGPSAANAAPRWGRWFRLIDTMPRPATEGAPPQVLMTGPGERPLLTLARVGEGRVATLLSDHVWLWARKYDGGGPHVELMRRLVHWLMKEPDLEEEQLSARLRGNRLEIIRRTLADAPPPLQVQMPDGKTRTLRWQQTAPGLFSAHVENPPTGLYRLKSGALTRIFPVGATDTPEMRDLITTADILAPLATTTGGGLRWISVNDGAGVRLPAVVKVSPGASAQGGGWLGIHQKEAARVLAVRHLPLFTGLMVLLGILLLLGLAWRLESR